MCQKKLSNRFVNNQQVAALKTELYVLKVALDETCSQTNETKTELDKAKETLASTLVQLKQLQQRVVRPDNQFFTGIDLVHEDKSILVKYDLAGFQSLRDAVQNHGKFFFPCGPQDGYLPPNPRFSAWTKLTFENSRQHIYQGELNQEGQKDGRGVTIVPGVLLDIGYYKNGQMHGQILSFRKDGSKYLFMYKEGLRHGKCVSYDRFGGKSWTDYY